VSRAPTTCPQCGSPIGVQQDWCLRCGTGARTRMVPTPNWRLPIATVLAIVLLAGAALVVAFLALTADTATTATVTTPPPPAVTATPTATPTPPTTPATATTPATPTT
jgi:hypothetical protein